ncbi:MAG TPA: hypothetical protein VIQ30_02315 [Pseudonocardia sp.]
MDKELRKIVNALEDQGFDVEVTKRGHVIVYRDTHFVASFGGTVSDWRAFRNSIAAARRAGFRWPPPKRKGKR